MGIIEEVVRPLMSGKEALVFLVVADGEHRVAKIYKEAQNRSFKHRAEYTEGRKVGNTRDQRAISKRSSHGRAQDEAAWRATEVETIYRLRSAGVRHIGVEEMKALQAQADRTLYRFDVRSEEEYTAGHLAGFRGIVHRI